MKPIKINVIINNGFDALEAELARYARVYAVMDSRVASECEASHVLAELFRRRSVPGMLIEASEQTKTMDTVMEVCSWLLEQGADRDALVLAIGGGVTSDIVGFAAAIYKRGIRSAYIPTTFLAQVDAAIGGKTGVNFNNYKNVLGVIRQPEFTYLCPQVLESLSRRDFLSGAAELLKTFIIEDNGYFDRAVQWLRGYALTQTQEAGAEYMKATMDELLDLIAAAAQVKISIVSRDQFERGERRKLNLGHTFGHAIETLAQRKGYDITHGEAVSMGILLAAELADSYEMRNPEEGLARRLDEAFLSCGLPIGCPFRVSAMTEIMRKDKKAGAGKVHFVLPFEVGDVRVIDFTVEDVTRLLSVK
jgi:3-dehydroquinate synthetase